MQEANIKTGDSSVGFISLFKLADLDRALLPYKNTEHYDTVIRYYFACIGMPDSHRLLEPLGLLKQTLAKLVGKRRVKRSQDTHISSPAGAGIDLPQIYDRVEQHEARLQFSTEQMKKLPTQVPKTFHFVWLGGGLGDIQRDYLTVWREVLARQGYTLNLWYDSDALLAWQTNKLIVEAAKANVFLQDPDERITEVELGALYNEHALVLKQQMQAHINAAVANGGSADEARIDLLTRAYGQDAQVLRQQLERNRRTVLDMDGFTLRDLAAGAVSLQLQEVYDREMRLLGNMAAASDVVRAEVLYAEGGSYTDIDHLPPLSATLGGVDISGFDYDARLGTLQLLLNENPEWMPGRQASSRYRVHIPAEHLPALEAFARSRPSLSEVFELPAERLARPFALRALSMELSLSNAFLMAHPGAGILKSVIDRMRSNYALIEASVQLAAQRDVALSDVAGMLGLVEEIFEQTDGPLSRLPMGEVLRAIARISAVATHFGDGIRFESEGTVHLTGPGAMRDGMADYANAHLSTAVAKTLREEAGIAPHLTVNSATEEEQDHSWKENGNQPEKWVANEQARWREGQYRTRYSGDITQLLKHSTVEFQQGWPLIEGRAVLLTDVLERLVEGLGEPFLEAMSQGHDGEIRFDKPLPLSFDDRQRIRRQAPDTLVPVFLSDAKMQSLGIDDVLNEIASGTRRVIEVSPVQRLSLGVLLGLDTLDNPRFNASTSELENLANSVAEQGVSGRYAVIERQLFKRKAAGFMNGLVSDPADTPLPSDSALELKKTALKQARTLLQWGRHVARIQKVATLEHRLQVVERSAQVLDGFGHAGVQMVPQDLLLNGDGEAIGGRCYPLALVMSAALAQGDASSGHLRERFFLAVLDPGQADSQAFLQTLEALRDVPMTDVGTRLGQANLDQVRATLEIHTGPRTLMLNSDNHSMLVAKTVSGERAAYHFFDPNFGLCKFDHADGLQRALETFFRTEGMARYYAAYGPDARPEFDLIDLHSQKIAGLELADGFTVEHLLKPDPLPGKPALAIRQRLNSAHGRSLVDNSHLGSSLLELDSHWWGQQIAQATVALQDLHDSATPLVPLFDTLEITPEGKYRVSLIDPAQPQQPVQVLSDDQRLLRIKNWLSEQFSTLARKPVETAGVLDPTEASSVHTLNAGFTIQALMNVLRGREGDDRTLTTAVRLHAYVNYAQLVHGNVVDVAGLVQLARTALTEERLIARTCAPIVGQALGHAANEGAGAVLGLANVGFDIYQLKTAQTGIETAQFGTQLTFDSASLALTAGGVGAGLAGASTAAAVLGGVGVMLGGLAVGVAALAQGFATIAREARQVGQFFSDLEQAYRGDGYHYDHSLAAWVARPSLLVKSIDLNEGTLLLDSPKLYPLRDHFGVPSFDPDDERTIDIRRELGLPGQVGFAPPAGQPIVLPCTPQTTYGYEYKALPFARWRHDRGFDTARRLEKKQADGTWLFLFSFYSFPSDYILNRLSPVYGDTVIKVNLDALERTLVVPVLPDAWQGKVFYWLRGAGGRCTVMLNPGADIRLVAPNQTYCRWVLQATWAKERDIRVEPSGELYIGSVHVTRVGRQEVLIRTAEQLFSVTQGKQQLDLVEQTAPAGLDEQALLDRYKELAREHRLALPYTPVQRFQIPFEDARLPRYTTAWYDAHEDRFLYIRDDLEVLGEPQLSVVLEGSAYFHDPEQLQIWQTDCATGLLKRRYLLLIQDGQSTIRSVEADAQGVIHVVQEYLVENKTVRQYRYLIHDGQLWLSSVTYDTAPQLQALLLANDTLAEWSSVLGNFLRLPSGPSDNGLTTVDWQPAPYVSICWAIAPDVRDMAWVRRRDRQLILAQPAKHHARGWDDSIKHLDGLMLLPMADDSDVFFVYQRVTPNQTLCRLQRSVKDGKAQWTHRWVQPDGLKQILAVEGGYVTLDENGLFFNLAAQGTLQFAGVSEHWLKGRARWWQALEPLAKGYPDKDFAIAGLRNAAGDGNLCAWYVKHRLLLCDPGFDKEVRLLGVTPDNQSVWLFDRSSGEVVSQAFFDPQQLDQVFGAGSQLLPGASLPAYQREWTGWRFADVTPEGTGLRGISVDGVSLALRHQETATITGVNHAWVSAQGDHLVEALQRLLDAAQHTEFVSVESEPGSLQWYDVQSARLLRVTGKNLPEDFTLLGTQAQVNVLLHEHQAGRVLIYPDKRSIGPFDYVQRNAQVLVVEGEKIGRDLLPLIPDEVNRLILRMGQGVETCHLTKAVWLKLESVIVDCRPALGETPATASTLIWAFDEPGKLLFEIVQAHLVIVDPDSERCLILRDVCSVDPVLRGEIGLGFNAAQSRPVSTFVARLKGLGATGSATLKELLAPASLAE
ncbi:TcdA/TcdB pore-forming domain-containing protein [Pseudomonas beijingensis]|uniref:TcdA/TcdB pore-forming domain-containing protein n=1 Tax=Pseudomonas beijingensis TaxID=2954101 RepID=UPI0027361C77|nr:TcdA/TcdB pore-forming domain-containing protein [Pseudomonas sp. FP830]WLI46783.1 TcdA/TcdB pore-forming domain-containing protein [Pseudomonas sp. FP830]